MEKIKAYSSNQKTRRQDIEGLIQYLQQHMTYIQVDNDVLPQYDWVTKEVRADHEKSSSGIKLVIPGSIVSDWNTLSPNHIEISKCVKLGKLPRTGDEVRMGEQFFHIAVYSPNGSMDPFYVAELGEYADLYKQIDQIHQSTVDCEIRAKPMDLGAQLFYNKTYRKLTLYNVPHFVAQMLLRLYGEQK